MPKASSSSVSRRKQLLIAKEDLKFVRAAIREIIGGAQRYSIDNRSADKADLRTLLEERDRLEDLVDALSGGTGRFRRIVPTDR